MKRTIHVLVSVIVFAIVLLPSCLAQSDNSLGDTARAQRKDKSAGAAKVFDNDTLPRDEHISVVGHAATPTPAALNDNTTEPADDTQTGEPQPKDASDKTKLTIDPGQSAGDRELVYGEWRKKVSDQKDTITLLQRELDVLQREYRLRAAAMYADVGNRLRNSNQWDKEDRDYKDKIEAKQKDLDRAKQQLNDMRDQARKMGVPAGVVE